MEQKEIEEDIRTFFEGDKHPVNYYLAIKLAHEEDEWSVYKVDIKSPEDAIKIMSAISSLGFEIEELE